MSRAAPRTIDEYLRAEVASHPGKSEADVLELIASTYGAPEEVADAYRDTEAKVRAALATPPPRGACIAVLALTLQLARGLGRRHARLAKAMLVVGSGARPTAN